MHILIDWDENELVQAVETIEDQVRTVTLTGTAFNCKPIIHIVYS